MSRIVLIAVLLMALIASGAAAQEFGWGHRTGPTQTYYDVIISDQNFTITHVDLDTFVPPVRTSMTQAYFDTFVPVERTSITRVYFDEFVPRERSSPTQAYFDAFVWGRIPS